MFQGCQNWSWISQGVLGSNFRAGHRKSGGRAIQLVLNFFKKKLEKSMHTVGRRTYIHVGPMTFLVTFDRLVHREGHEA